MINKFIIFLTLCSVHIVYGQSPTSGNALTGNHKNIKGTAAWIIPPPNFVPAPNFKGFMDTATQIASIMLMELPGPYAEIIKGFSGTQPLPSGMVITGKENLQIAGLEALLVHLDQTANGQVYEKYILLFGDSLKTFIINGLAPKEMPSVGQEIKQSLLGLYYDINQAINSRVALDYTIDESNTKLIFSSVMGNAMLFSPDGKTPTQSKDKTAFFADKSFSDADIPDRKAFCIKRVNQLGYINLEIEADKGIQEIKINGLNGFEIFATGYDKRSNTKEYIYQVILFPPKGYFLLLGTYEEDTKENVTTIKKIARTFMRK